MLSHRFEEALTFAAQLHRNQSRKGSGVPYISHLMAVSSLALEHGANEDEAIAALLHDAIEDQGGNSARREILRRFGPRVTEIVEGCTDADTFPKPPWRPRKEAYIDHLKGVEPSVWLVVACDKLHNARSIVRDYRVLGESLWTRFNGGREGTLWYYRAVLEALRKPHPVIEELENTVKELEQLANGGGGRS
jgi:GTP pyrophosphokinase